MSYSTVIAHLQQRCRTGVASLVRNNSWISPDTLAPSKPPPIGEASLREWETLS